MRVNKEYYQQQKLLQNSRGRKAAQKLSAPGIEDTSINLSSCNLDDLDNDTSDDDLTEDDSSPLKSPLSSTEPSFSILTRTRRSFVLDNTSTYVSEGSQRFPQGRNRRYTKTLCVIQPTFKLVC